MRGQDRILTTPVCVVEAEIWGHGAQAAAAGAGDLVMGEVGERGSQKQG